MIDGSLYVLMSTVFTPAEFRVAIFTATGMLSLRSTSRSTTSMGKASWPMSSGHVATAPTSSMSSAAERIHSVSAPSSIRWSSTIASVILLICRSAPACLAPPRVG